VLVAHVYNPATQEAKIRMIAVQSQPGEIICETLSRKNPSQNRTAGVKVKALSSNPGITKNK
jgi:hypothetical protein